MVIVLPDGIYGNESLKYVRDLLLKQVRIVAVIDVPVETFLPNTGTKTSIMIIQKMPSEKIPEDYPVFMAVAEFCGHDRRGNEIEKDDIIKVSREFKEWSEKNNFSFLEPACH
jgi:type I restriction enzyme M protein